VIGDNTQIGIYFDNSIMLNLYNCDIESNGTTRQAGTDKYRIRLNRTKNIISIGSVERIKINDFF
jgi:hypothetical protein